MRKLLKFIVIIAGILLVIVFLPLMFIGVPLGAACAYLKKAFIIGWDYIEYS